MLETALHLIRSWGELGAAGVALMAVTFVIGSLAFVPRPALCLLSGLVFGFAFMPVALAAATVGAVVAFLVSRYLLRSHVRRAIAGRRPLEAIAEAIDTQGWPLVGLLRLSPAPGTALNYALGVTGISLRQYATGTLLGLTPSVLVFVYLGAMGATVLDPSSITHAHFAFLAVGFVAIAIAFWLVARKARATLAGLLRAQV
jgi:uncharacterized membrane protein YdjX (TVP38/TMEM64 family)